MRFTDRTEAGKVLAERLEYLRGEDVVVLALPRGGVPIGTEVASSLGAPLDVVVVRKLGVPFQPELAMGAIGEGGVRLLDHRVVRRSRVHEDQLAAVERAERGELLRRLRRYRAVRPATRLTGKTAVVVDDGVATGSTARAACRVARLRGADRVVFAAPVCSPDAIGLLRRDADEVVCVSTPAALDAIGRYYDDFHQVSDAEVVRALTALTATSPVTRPIVRQRSLEIPVGRVRLQGDIAMPENPVGAVVFAHGSGSSRHSPRNRHVAAELNRAGLATLLIDLLTSHEELDQTAVFDVNLLAHRLTAVTGWLRGEANHTALPIGYFGASTGAAAALRAAADPRADIHAIVCRGGRPDLAEPWLGAVRAPTLLIVGGQDEEVARINDRARLALRCENRLVVVRGAGHLFEEPGALDTVARLACDWFTGHLAARARPSA